MSEQNRIPDEDGFGTLVVTGPDGEPVECDVLFTFTGTDTGKDYIVYTDNTTDEEGNVQVYAATYDPEGDGSQLEEIETAEEWEVIEGLLARVQELTQEAIANGGEIDAETLTRQIQEEFGGEDDEDGE